MFKDSIGYYFDTAQGKYRIKRDPAKSKTWMIYTFDGTIESGFPRLKDAVTYLKEGWHTL